MIAWLLRTFRRHPPTLARDPADQREAQAELERARETLHTSEKQAEVGKKLAKDLGKINRENHFAERAVTALRGIVR